MLHRPFHRRPQHRLLVSAGRFGAMAVTSLAIATIVPGAGWAATPTEGAGAAPRSATATAVAASAAGGAFAVALIVGVNRSVDSKLPLLHYADDDAVRYDELFRTLGARTHLLLTSDENTRRVAPQVVARARAPRRGELSAALAQIGAEVAAARAQGRPTVFYFVYAGHGSLSHGEAYLALQDAHLNGMEIEHEVIDLVHADRSHLIIDACYSYFLAYGRGPGGSRRELHGFAPVEGLARRADVGLLLSTTSARESHEWEGFQAGVFSHEVRSGLFGAADFDGDGRVSYREIAAFIERANAAIPNERFRPDVFARAPAAEPKGELLDLRPTPGLPRPRHLLVDGDAQAGRYFLDDTRGVRLVDFHNAPGHDVRLLLPSDSGRLYLRRAGDDREFEIPTSPEVIALSQLDGREPRATARGAAHDAFSLIFALPFDEQAFVEQASGATAADQRQLEAGVSRRANRGEAADGDLEGRPRWRTVGGTVAAGVATVSLVGAAALMLSARGLTSDARQTTQQRDAAALVSRAATRNQWARVGAAVGGVSAVTSVLLLLWPHSTLFGSGSVDGESAQLELGGRF